MIGLAGRHPREPAGLQAISKQAADALTAKVQSTGISVLTEKDFPNHWGGYKFHFIRPQFNGKCAYCETLIVPGSPGDVEHFRPKSYCQPLKPAKNRDDLIGKSPGRKTHGEPTEGYWWLAYAWTNYLLSCSRCNSTWKKNQFPVVGDKVAYGGNIADEEALLLNPFEDDPEPHFEFDVHTGQIRGVTEQGVNTIDVCGLDRRSLEVQRQTKGAKLIRRYQEYLYSLKTKNTDAANHALRAMSEECRGKEAFAAVARYFVREKTGFSYSDLLKMRRRKII